MKFGIIGLGNHAKNRVMPAIVKAGHEVSAIYSRNIEKAKNEGLKYFSKPYNDLETFLNGDFDAVYISSPNFLHYEHARNALLHGKHVLLEKPMTLETAHAEDLVKLSEERKLSLAVGFHMRFHPAVNEIKRMVDNDELGDITYVAGMWAHYSSRAYDDPDSRWWKEDEKVGGGSVMATGVHVIDTINYILSSSPNLISAIRNPADEVIDTTEHISMQYSYIIADALSSRAILIGNNSLAVYGTKGSAVAQDAFSTSIQSKLLKDHEILKEYSTGNMYVEEIKAFVDFSKGLKSSIATGRDGLAVVKIVNAAVKSSKEGKKVMP